MSTNRQNLWGPAAVPDSPGNLWLFVSVIPSAAGAGWSTVGARDAPSASTGFCRSFSNHPSIKSHSQGRQVSTRGVS